jgi:hypothetical protein
MTLPKTFGNDWDQFINDWCVGTIPATDQSTTELGLNTLIQLWPAYIQKMTSNPARGLTLILPAVHLGLVLDACKSLNGFDKILQRIKSGESSALSELKFAEKLIRIGIEPHLEPILNNKVPDTKIVFDDKEIFFEVIAPETSDVIKGAELEMQEFALELLNLIPGKRIEVFLKQDITNDIREKIRELIKQFEKTKITVEIPDVAITTIQDEPFDLVITPQIEKNDSDAVLGVAKCFSGPEQKTLAIVRLCITDLRAKRLLSAESHHFSKDQINILVMDVTNVVGGMKKWMEIISRCLQPNQNRRFSAVIFFSEGLYVDKIDIKQTWKIVTNEHADNKAPKELLDMIVSD